MTKPKMSEMLRMRLPTEMLDELKTLALRLDRPLSWVVREALQQYLEAENAKAR